MLHLSSVYGVKLPFTEAAKVRGAAEMMLMGQKGDKLTVNRV
jgi:hypothetical protein